MFDFLLRPLRRNFGRDKEYYRQIDELFGFIPNNIELYKLALIHKSASFVLPDGSQMNNERLEYLGDAIIEAVTSDYLYIEFPDKTEGFLTQLRSKIVSRHSLNLLAERIGLDRLLVAHAGATVSQKHIYGDAFEAMIGAIYLDQGYDFTNRLLINNIYANHLDMDSLSEEETDFKSRLIEWCQKNHHTIRFVTKHTSGTQFLSTIFIDDMEVSHGRGTSKKESEQHAAQTMAQTVTDSACLRMLDRLDKIDMDESEVRPQPAKSRHTKAAPVAKSEQTKSEQTKSESEPSDGAKEPAKREESKPKRAPKAVVKPEPKSVVKAEVKLDAKAELKREEPKTEPKTEPKSESVEGAQEGQSPAVERPKRQRRTPKGPKGAAQETGSEVVAEKAALSAVPAVPATEPVKESAESAEPATEKGEKAEVAEKPKRSRSRRAPKREAKGQEQPVLGEQPDQEPKPEGEKQEEPKQEPKREPKQEPKPEEPKREKPQLQVEPQAEPVATPKGADSQPEKAE